MQDLKTIEQDASNALDQKIKDALANTKISSNSKKKEKNQEIVQAYAELQEQGYNLSNSIRILKAMFKDATYSEIARALDKRTQHIRNVLTYELKS